MKRALILSMALGLFAPLCLVGCGDESKREVEIKQEGPGGSTTERVTKETEQTGDNPPAPTGAGAPAPNP